MLYLGIGPFSKDVLYSTAGTKKTVRSEVRSAVSGSDCAGCGSLRVLAKTLAAMFFFNSSSAHPSLHWTLPSCTLKGRKHKLLPQPWHGMHFLRENASPEIAQTTGLESYDHLESSQGALIVRCEIFSFSNGNPCSSIFSGPAGLSTPEWLSRFLWSHHQACNESFEAHWKERSSWCNTGHDIINSRSHSINVLAGVDEPPLIGSSSLEDVKGVLSPLAMHHWPALHQRRKLLGVYLTGFPTHTWVPDSSYL